MIKNYKTALDEAGDAYSETMSQWEHQPSAFRGFLKGAEFAFNYQQAKIDKLVEALRQIDNSTECGYALEIVDEALAQYEKDGE